MIALTADAGWWNSASDAPITTIPNTPRSRYDPSANGTGAYVLSAIVPTEFVATTDPCFPARPFAKSTGRLGSIHPSRIAQRMVPQLSRRTRRRDGMTVGVVATHRPELRVRD